MATGAWPVSQSFPSCNHQLTICSHELQKEVYAYQLTNNRFNILLIRVYIHSKLDLLVRVRYSNPLPAPPCPPKLLDIPTNPLRYTRPEFLNDIASDTPLPMIVDAECGMPLDLGKFDCLWEDGGDESGACLSHCNKNKRFTHVSMARALQN